MVAVEALLPAVLLLLVGILAIVLVRPIKLSPIVGYLIEAASVTGQLLCVDGGQHLAWRTPDVLGVE